MNEAFAVIRELLSYPPSWERWNELILLLDMWPKDDGALSLSQVVTYVREHLDASWPNRWRVGNGCWPENSQGWLLLKGETRKLPHYDDLREVWCPPGTYLVDADEYQRREVTLTRPFWIQDQLHEYAERLNWYEAIAYCNELSRQANIEESYVITEEQGTCGEGEMWENWYSDEYWQYNYYYYRIPNYSCRVEWKRLDSPGYRLPTEAELTIALLAASPTDYDGVAFVQGSYQQSKWKWRHHHPGARNAWGISNSFPAHETNHLWNVKSPHWQWCWDVFQSPLPWAHVEDPLGPQSNDEEAPRVMRGGADSLFERFSSPPAPHETEEVGSNLQTARGLRVCRTDIER